MAPIRLETVDAVQITTLVDNYFDTLMPDQGPAKRAALRGPSGPRVANPLLEEGSGPDMPRAEHGFSALLTVERNGRQHTILFDTGVSPDGMVENMRRLQLPAKEIETVVLSHGHFDHTMGLEGLQRELGRSGLPLVLHPQFWNRRRLVIEGREPIELPTTSKPALRGAGFEIVEERQPSFLLDGALLITGEVDRTTDFEIGMPMQQAFKHGAWEPDTQTLDDQAIILHLRDKGLLVLTGCGHAGIVNIVRYARKLTGIEPIYAIMGGFHLGGRVWEPTIAPTVAALAWMEPQVVVPAHCTGWRATHALASALPEAFIQNSVGTRFEL